MIKPFVKKLSECSGYADGNATFLSVDEAETISSNFVRIKEGETTPSGSIHDDEEEIYIVLKGKAKIKLNDTEHIMEAGDIVYIPRNTLHEAVCVSKEDLEYICVANWPDKMPAAH
ncbi:cupin domain-containing protein [Paenibacillus eucommiae]|uniref:Mannose-6-phosphate isomerase-like protein (Cupin superfamily) n=1 Tax=Paenibacillus eucommiae TaxID=1355755 RepID=A0ABS4IX93_9BACL|nr:cupin domain-containing protein [Paenibacillus eucommiae]MBP1992199.1 mannose-6-phosphate isomerase-like protein (cupin superfamily) [Paenibacillus eucommiae]